MLPARAEGIARLSTPDPHVLYPGEEGFVLDKLLRMKRLHEALQYQHPGSEEATRASAWIQSTQVTIVQVGHDAPAPVVLSMATLQKDLLAGLDRIAPEADYEFVRPALEAEVAHPLRRL